MNSFASALELAASIRRREVSPLEVVDHYLERTDRLNPELNAVIWRRDEELRNEARAAGEALANGKDLGPFHGVPIPIKDLNDVAGWPTTFGCRGARDRIATRTSSVVESFRRAGFLLMYRTNTPEFGTLCVTENELYGATRNPWNPGHTPGGSSGGAASCVASAMAPIAHANDGGGSIRIPASCSGLVGLKPSRGRVSSGPLASDLMHGGAVEGCVSRTVADTAAVLDAIAGSDPGAWYNAPPPQRPFLEEVGAEQTPLRIGFSNTPPTDAPVSADCVRAVEHTAQVLEQLGHHVYEVTTDWPDLDTFVPAFMCVWSTGSAYWDVSDWDAIEPVNAALRQQALDTSSVDYVKSVLALQIGTRQVVASWGRDFDLLLTPTLATPPPAIGALFENNTDPIEPLLRAADVAPFTPLFNSTGQPAISLPMHWNQDGLPIGVQLVGAPWGEATLLRVAAQLEEAAPWADKHPPLS